MQNHIKNIRAALTLVADSGESTTTKPVSTTTEDATLLPYEAKTNRPAGFPLEEYSLKPVGDLRRMKPIMAKLTEVTTKIKEIDEQCTNLNVETQKKILELRKEKGYETANQELKTLSERAATEIQKEVNEVSAAYGDSKKILLEYNETVYAIYDEMKKTTVSDKEKLALLEQSMAKLLSPELVTAVTELVNTGVAQMEKAKSEVKRKFVSWHGAKTLRKEVKEELPKKVESLRTQAGVFDALKSFLSGLWDTVKQAFAPVKENAADLQSLLETEVAPLLEQAASVTASKKQAATFPTSMSDMLLRDISFQELIDTVVSNEPVRDEAALNKVFKQLLQATVADAKETFKAELPMLLKELEKATKEPVEASKRRAAVSGDTDHVEVVADEAAGYIKSAIEELNYIIKFVKDTGLPQTIATKADAIVELLEDKVLDSNYSYSIEALKSELK